MMRTGHAPREGASWGMQCAAAIAIMWLAVLFVGVFVVSAI